MLERGCQVKSYKYIDLYMFNPTPFLPGFGRQTWRRLQSSTANSLAPLEVLWGPIFNGVLSRSPAKRGPNSRRRVWTVPLTFWTFLSQVLCPGSACREAVRKAAAWVRASTGQILSEDESAYCQARQRLPLKLLFRLWRQVRQRLQQQSTLLWHGHEVFVVDGTECKTPDTPANQERWPQPSTQKPGCGFPHIRLLGLFSLASGALLRVKIGSGAVSEQRLLAKIWGTLRQGALLLADRNFCGYAQLALLRQRAVHFAFRLQAVRPHDLRKGRRLGAKDRLIRWSKPLLCPKSLTAKEFQTLPEFMELRLLRFTVCIRGFRTRTVHLATSLLDPETYPLEELAQLYRLRWQIELCFRHVKITLQMENLRCKTPEMVIKELLMHLISYNLTRHLMLSVAQAYHLCTQRISFKGTLDTFRHWSCALLTVANRPKKKNNFIAQMLYSIARDLIPHRPNRVEPRAVKARSKHYPDLSRPRKLMKTIPHASRRYAKLAKLRRALS